MEPTDLKTTKTWEGVTQSRKTAYRSSTGEAPRVTRSKENKVNARGTTNRTERRPRTRGPASNCELQNSRGHEKPLTKTFIGKRKEREAVRGAYIIH